MRKEIALTFIKHFQGDDPFILIDPSFIYLMGKGLSDENPDIQSMFVSAAQYAYKKNLLILKVANKRLYNPDSLSFIQFFLEECLMKTLLATHLCANHSLKKLTTSIIHHILSAFEFFQISVFF